MERRRSIYDELHRELSAQVARFAEEEANPVSQGHSVHVEICTFPRRRLQVGGSFPADQEFSEGTRDELETRTRTIT